jgi:hypothetical protein
MINQKVQLKQSCAKWHLEHPEIYGFKGALLDPYETDTLLHLVCCLGEPVYGKVIAKGNSGCWLVKWEIGDLSAQYYVARHHFNVTKLYRLVT